ncbi:MAG: hypothetical protein JSU69_09865 [Candidatus Zixiibacteriota bacterium]|nr:MAG: hypothetical protein JSU69_09865 [candidate division Zixibacteria bacterium]
MKAAAIDKETIESVGKALESEATELIDFDLLRKVLGDLSTIMEARDRLQGELDFIKEEYRRRIVGMLKANMACKSEADDMEMAARVSGDISRIEAPELIKLYARAAARFRANFPSSFKYVNFPSRDYSKDRWTDHKI